MDIPLTSMEQLLPFPTAQELIAKNHKPLESVSPSMTVLEALQLMAEKSIGFLAVIENGKLAGVRSERESDEEIQERRSELGCAGTIPATCRKVI